MRTDWSTPVVASLVLLGALAAHHLLKGFYYLAIQEPPTAIADYAWRRIDSAYFLDRVPPQSQNFAYLSAGDPALKPLAVHADWSERHGSDNFSGLPPWTYVMYLGVYLPIAHPFARGYLAALNAAALALVAWLAYDESRRRHLPPPARAVAVLAVLAIGATNDALSDGQTSIVINAGLAVAFLALRQPARRAWDIAAGVGFAIAMAKPTLGMLFLAVPLIRRRWAILVTCAAVVTATWLASAWWVHLSPLFQLAQFEQASRLVLVSRGVNVWLHGLSRALSPELARDILGLLGVALALYGAYRLRSDVSASFAFLAVVSRLYSYHGGYDDVLLAFLVIYLSALAWREPSGISRAMIVWLVVGASLWLPYSLYESTAARWAQSLCWLGAAGWVLERSQVHVTGATIGHG